MDKSKGDALAKFVAVGQTTWFIAQCIARGLKGVAITNIEILTLSFAMLNFLTYFLWWNKPQRVCYPIIVRHPVDSSPQGTVENEKPTIRLNTERSKSFVRKVANAFGE